MVKDWGKRVKRGNGKKMTLIKVKMMTGATECKDGTGVWKASKKGDEKGGGKGDGNLESGERFVSSCIVREFSGSNISQALFCSGIEG